MNTIKMTIQYDGTSFYGWQRQSKLRSVQGTIEKSLSKILNTKITIDGASRTDTGVHALGQVATFTYKLPMALDQLKRALNNDLDADVAIVKMESVGEDFHARYSAKGKTYLYYVHQGPIKNVFKSNYSYYYPYDLDYDKMSMACKKLMGKHNFGSFKASGSSAQNPIRTIDYIGLDRTADGYVFEFRGDGFLYKMVRLMVAYILNIGNDKISLESLSEVLEKPSRKYTHKVAPAQGLYLKTVFYENQ